MSTICREACLKGANNLWHVLRSKGITASKFGIVAKRLRDFENLSEAAHTISFCCDCRSGAGY